MLRRWLAFWGLAVALAVLPSSVGAADVLSARAFQDRVVEAIVKRYPQAGVERLDANQLRITLPGQEPTTSNLERAYLLYEATPSELGIIVTNIASSLDASSRPIRAEALIVLVRPAAYVATLAEGSAGVLTRPLPGDMVAVVALDEPDSYAMKPMSDLGPALKLDADGIWSRAIANTLPHVNFAPREVPDGRIIEISTGQGVASSLLVNEAFWNAPALTRHGPLVVAAFARDSLLVTRLSDTSSVQKLRQVMAASATIPTD